MRSISIPHPLCVMCIGPGWVSDRTFSGRRNISTAASYHTIGSAAPTYPTRVVLPSRRNRSTTQSQCVIANSRTSGWHPTRLGAACPGMRNALGGGCAANRPARSGSTVPGSFGCPRLSSGSISRKQWFMRSDALCFRVFHVIENKTGQTFGNVRNRFYRGLEWLRS
jgi:hypothetical protein